MHRSYRDRKMRADCQFSGLNVGDLTADRESYRALAQQALHALRHLTVERDRLRVRIRALLERLRVLRAAPAQHTPSPDARDRHRTRARTSRRRDRSPARDPRVTGPDLPTWRDEQASAP